MLMLKPCMILSFALLDRYRGQSNFRKEREKKF